MYNLVYKFVFIRAFKEQCECTVFGMRWDAAVTRHLEYVLSSDFPLVFLVTWPTFSPFILRPTYNGRGG